MTSSTVPRSGRQVRLWEPGWPVPVGSVLGVHRRGRGDPTYKIDLAGRHWRGLRTPLGPATLMVDSRLHSGEVYSAAFGPGAEWALASVPGLLGAYDDPSGFEPRHPVIAQAHAIHQHWRFGRTGLVMDSLLPSIIEQKVTGQEAFGGFRALVQRYGERAPGPGHDLDLWVQPHPDVLRVIPSWEWLKLHIDPARSRAVVMAARVADSIQRISGLDGDEADSRLRSLPGVGVWTSAEVRQRALGDPDAVSFGDYHVAKDIGWALTGEQMDDLQLAELLEPWRPQRGRVQALVTMSGLRRPRHGPRMAPRTHLPSP